MPTYVIRPKDDHDKDAYWVQAGSEDEARRLVSLNKPADEGDVMDPELFECVSDKTKTPPEGAIHRRLWGPMTIKVLPGLTCSPRRPRS